MIIACSLRVVSRSASAGGGITHLSGGGAFLFGYLSYMQAGGTTGRTTVLCVAVADGTEVTTTVPKSIPWTTGTNVSGDTCALMVRSTYLSMESSNDATLAIEAYGDADHYA
jgi:hypothetical protein